MEQQNALYENQIRIQNESNEKIRLLRHDMKNHIYQIKAFLKRKDYEKLEEYMNRMSDQQRPNRLFAVRETAMWTE